MALKPVALLAVVLAAAGCKTSIDTKLLPYRCSPDAGPDPSDNSRYLPDGKPRQCPPGMRCGLEGFCHDLSGGSYQCLDDSWCDNGWHCSFQGICQQASSDPLVQGFSGTLSGTPVSPLATARGQITAIEASFSASAVLPGNQEAALRSVVFILSDGGIVQTDELLLGFGGIQGALVVNSQGQLPVPISSVKALAVAPGTTWIVSGGTLAAFKINDGGVVPFLISNPGDAGAANDLRATPSLVVPFEAKAGGRLWPFRLDADAGVPEFSASPPTFIEAPEELIGLDLPGCEEALLMTSDAGHLFYLTQDGGMFTSSFNPVPLGPAANGSARRVRSQGNLLAVEEASDAGMVLALYQVNVGTSCDSLSAASVASPGCLPCEPDEAIEEFFPVNASPTAIEVYCSGPRGQHSVLVQEQIGPLGQGCAAIVDPLGSTSFLDETQTLHSQRSPGVAAFLGSHGNIWTGRSLSGVSAYVVPDLPGDTMSGNSATELLTYSRDGDYARNAPTGLNLFAIGATTNLGMACEVRGPAHALLLRVGEVQVHVGPPGDINAGANVAIAAVADPTLPFNSPWNAISFDAGNALALVVSSNDAILAADVSASIHAPDGGIAPLTLRVIPEPGNAIRSIVSAPPAAGAPNVLVYAMTSNALFTVTGNLGDLSWRSTSVALPPGPASKLLTQGAHVRIAYQDGRLYSLTTGLLLAPTLDGGAKDFESFCGDTYALAPDSLYRLFPAADGGVTGVWTDVGQGVKAALPSGDGNFGFDKGRLRVPDNGEGPAELEVMTGFGSLAAVRPATGTCSP